MKHIEHFDAFLRDVVNLNQTRIDTLEDRVETIKSFVRNSPYEPTIVRFNPQGSWAHKTIIKPPGERDFDADLLMIVKEIANWELKKYIEALHKTFSDTDRYRDMVSRKTRCVRINYAGDFHLDLIPIIEEYGHNGPRYFNCNRRVNRFEETAPEEYTEWWRTQNRISRNNQLRKVTRLLKYIRDTKPTFACKSILFTTLIGYQINDYDHLLSTHNFSDLPTSLKTIVSRLDDFLQQHVLMPRVLNPILPCEDYNRHWDQQKYENFRNKIHQYREWIDDAYAEQQDIDESILKWRKVFGDEFAGSVIVKANSRELVPLFRFADKWIDRIKSLGRQVLRDFPRQWEHVVDPRWRMDERQQIQVRVQAGLARHENGTIEGTLTSGDVVPTNRWIRFEATASTGIPATFHVHWRVANTGGDAARNVKLRGGFYPSKPAATRWEQTKFRGVHWVEAFVVNNRTKKCVGESDRFFIVIE